MHPTIRPVPPIQVAHNLLSRICAVAKAAHDHGREFLCSNLHRLTGLEINFRRQQAGNAETIVNDLDRLNARVRSYLQNDGKIDRHEAGCLLRLSRHPRLSAAKLARDLDLPR